MLSIKTARKNKRILWILATISILVVSIIVVYIPWPHSGYRDTIEITAQPRYLREGTDESKPTDDELDGYRVSPDVPRAVYIDTLQIGAKVSQMGINPDTTMQAPVNIYDTGWYTGSAKPGKPGAVIINGHVTGPTQKGVFYDLNTLRKQDTIVIERGDGQRFSYSVVDVETIPVERLDMKKVFQVIEGQPEGLNLITCAGTFDTTSRQYREQTIVYAIRKY